MHDYIKNITKVDDLDIVDGSERLKEMYENNTIGDAEVIFCTSYFWWNYEISL